MRYILSTLLSLALFWAAGSSSFAADFGGKPAHKAPYSNGIILGDEWGLEGREDRAPRACNDPKILKRIMERFAWAEENTWHRGFTIAKIQNVRQREEPLKRVSYIPRRYCQANALMTNGHHRKVYYNIGIELGFASVGDGVSFCLPGLDPWYVYGAHCSTVR